MNTKCPQSYCSPNRFPVCRFFGFTLVELMVVIAIISILAAMLLPALEKSLASAHDLSCRSNLRNLAFSIDQYLNDNADVYPYAKNIGTSPYTYWATLLLPYADNPNVLTCPCASGSYSSIDTAKLTYGAVCYGGGARYDYPGPQWTDYQMVRRNDGARVYGVNADGTLKHTGLHGSSSVVTYAKNAYIIEATGPNPPFWGKAEIRHTGHMNYISVDLAVRWAMLDGADWEYYYQLSSPLDPGALWYRTGTGQYWEDWRIRQFSAPFTESW